MCLIGILSDIYSKYKSIVNFLLPRTKSRTLNDSQIEFTQFGICSNETWKN